MSKILNPEIRINYSWLLTQDVSRKIAEYEGNKTDLFSHDGYEKYAERYRRAWLKNENKILSALQNVTGLQFYLNVIDIAVAPWIKPKSHPLIISYYDSPETVAYTITHELTHTLLCDNKIISIYGESRKFSLTKEWQKLYGFEDDFTALVHVPVHAINKIVFENYIDDKQFVIHDRNTMEEFGAVSYLKSWDYVEKHGAEKILEKLRHSYIRIAKKLERSK